MDEQQIVTPLLKPSLQSIDESEPAVLFGAGNKVFISGGGPVGLMMAIGLSRLGAEVILAEKISPVKEKQDNYSDSTDSSFDGRVLALSYGSRLILEELKVWKKLKPYFTDIKSVHVSQKGYLGITYLHAEEMNVPALGYSIASSDLGKVLWKKVKKNKAIKVLCPASLEALEMSKDQATISVALESANGKKQDFTVDLVIGADGTESTVRKLLDLKIAVKDYNSVAVITKITTEQSPKNWAYERFTPEGAVALLPMGGKLSKAVLVFQAEQMAEIKSLDDKEFMQLFANEMGERLGEFIHVSERVFYPLKETYVPQMTKGREMGRAILIGNASHTQHPVAAQGLNLGIADIKAFLDLAKSMSLQNIGDPKFLKVYAKQRHEHHQKIMGLTDGLIGIFQEKSPIIGHMRGMGLMAMQAFSPLRKRLSKLSMGI